MTQYSISDLSRKSGDIIAEALRRPVTITQRNKPRLVLFSIEDNRKLTARADTRKAGRIETMPDACLTTSRRPSAPMSGTATRREPGRALHRMRDSGFAIWVRKAERVETECRKPRPVAVGVRIARPESAGVIFAA